MISRRTPLLAVALGALALGACECIKPVQQCPNGFHCISYDEYCDQSNQALWAMGQVCGVIAKEVAYPAAYPQRDLRCTEALRVLVDAGTVSFNDVGAQLCLQSLRTTCDPVCRWEVPDSELWTPGATTLSRCSAPCDRVFTGTKETGESCSLSVECLEGLWCDATKTCPGRCARQVSEGDTAPSLEACRAPIANPLVDGGLRCEELIDAGARCERADDELGWHHCQPGYACVHALPPPAPDGGLDGGGTDAGDDAGSDGGALDAGPEPFFCLPFPDGGVLDAHCDSSGCPYGQLCVVDATTRGVCTAYADAGSSCASGAPGPLTVCIGGLECLSDSGAGGVCGKATEGSACGLFSLNPCTAGDYCGADGGCTVRFVTGGPCDGTYECQLGLICAAGSDGGFVCAARSVAGQPCDDDGGHFCAFGFSCFDGGCLTNSCLPSP